MNERIRELAIEAGIIIDFNDPLYGQLSEGTKQKQLVITKKFAELIVEECLEACSRANDIRHFVPPTQEQVVLSCMREIETTFRN